LAKLLAWIPVTMPATIRARWLLSPHRRATAPAYKIILLGVLRRHVLGVHHGLGNIVNEGIKRV